MRNMSQGNVTQRNVGGIMQTKKGFLRVRVVEVFQGDPRWSPKIGEVVVDVRHNPFKVWFVLAMRLGGFKDLQVRVVP